MDAITFELLSLIHRLIDNRSVNVRIALTKPFHEACRDLHIVANGGAFTIDTDGSIYGQMFYID